MRTAEVELGYLARPAAGDHPGVVMIHDVWGLSEHTRDLARRLAAEGFEVLALDLYRRRERVEIRDPGRWMRELSDPEVLSDVQAGAERLVAEPGLGRQRVGVTGFCMGGMYALLAACSCPGISASVAYYGMLSHEHGLLHAEGGLDPALKPRQPLDAVGDLRCPLLAFFGDEDDYIPLSDVRQLERCLAEIEREAEVIVYPGAGHAFMNDTRPDAFRPNAAKDAWGRMVAFFRRHLAA